MKAKKLKMLEIAGPKSFQYGQEQKGKDLHTLSCLHGVDESQTSTRQIKKLCQANDLHTPSCFHGADKSQTSTRQVKAQIKAIQTLDLSRKFLKRMKEHDHSKLQMHAMSKKQILGKNSDHLDNSYKE